VSLLALLPCDADKEFNLECAGEHLICNLQHLCRPRVITRDRACMVPMMLAKAVS